MTDDSPDALGWRTIMTARQGGKRLALEREIASHLKRHPKATIIRCSSADGVRIERYVEAVEIAPLALPKPPITEED